MAELAEQLLAAVERRHRKREILLMLTIIVLALLVAFLGWQRFRPQPVTPASEQAARTPAGVEQAADHARVPLTKPQVREVAEEITATAGKPPDRVEASTGREAMKKAEESRKDAGADFSIVTNPEKPGEKSAVKPDAPVNLNVYNIKAYPRRMAELSIGVRGADVAYVWRVDVPRVPLLLPKGAVGYIGPFVRAEYGTGKVDGGLRVVIPF